ncbi:three-Cys-motif partner protein TcmP [Sphingomonas melonis]|uniref:Three-Cys-motif partner protein n=1 Tax=Sphingomonas melonis TaxID=152682 RepID=A0A7Y9K1G6_9SPHN|nr:three-Cys-motif partner protein TcmP [Sphingomonas melonis]NYD90918.1 three-Cys-motif partner protein [Sphingomonas melonis]
MTEHRFGGPWTEVKLDAIDGYARAYTTALKHQNFELWYVDAFAGTGSRTEARSIGGILDGAPIDTVELTLAGSARRALAVNPPFVHLRLIERRKEHYQALLDLQAQFPDRDVEPMLGNANTVLPRIFGNPPWTSRSEGRKQRALVFLDPYGISVTWATLRMLAETERADVWYLVNLKGICQQMPHDHKRLDPGKRAKLDEFFGGDDWEDQFYAFSPNKQLDLLSFADDRVALRSVTRERVGDFYRQRLRDKLFSYVSEPLSLKVRSADDYFQLYCMSNNKSPAAQSLIKSLASAVIKKHSAAFRRMSDH